MFNAAIGAVGYVAGHTLEVLLHPLAVALGERLGHVAFLQAPTTAQFERDVGFTELRERIVANRESIERLLLLAPKDLLFDIAIAWHRELQILPEEYPTERLPIGASTMDLWVASLEQAANNEVAKYNEAHGKHLPEISLRRRVLSARDMGVLRAARQATDQYISDPYGLHRFEALKNRAG